MFNDISYDEVAELLSYDPETGFLTWKERQVRKPQDKSWNTRWAGTAKDKDGYHVISIYNVNYRVNRIAFLLYTGRLNPEMLIDHIDKDRSNDRAENLREVTYSINNMNKSIPDAFMKNINKHNAGWMLKVQRNKKIYKTYFAHKDLELAKEFRDLLLEELDN